MIAGIRRDVRVLALLIGALIASAIITVVARPLPTDSPYLSSRSDAREGALALRLWLERSGYRVREAAPPDLSDLDALLILEPEPYTPGEAAAVRRWVESGRTLIIAGSEATVGALLSEFGISYGRLSFDASTAGAPSLRRPPVGLLPEDAGLTIRSGRTDLTPHLFKEGEPVVVSFRQGAGIVWLSGIADPFMNLGIQDDANARLMMNMLATIPAGAAVGFDEAVRGADGIDSVGEWLTETPPGWGVLLAVALTVIYLGVRGRRFGQPLPLPEEKLRREPVEYIAAIAGLYRRSGSRDEMLRHYGAQFRRRLARRYNLDPRLSDAELVRHVVYRDPEVDEAALRDLLRRLAKTGVHETELLQTAHDADEWLRRTP